MVSVGVVFPPDQPPTRLRAAAERIEAAGLDEIWLWEDCFAEGGIASAGVALAATTRIRVGIGLLPVPLRNVALAAMEIATLAEQFPGRLLPGIGHGVLDWMGQAGVRVSSPMQLLREYAVALRRLLHGEEVSCAERYVTLDRVALRWPPAVPPPLLVGGVGPKTLTLAGEVGDGAIFTGGTTPEQLRTGIDCLLHGRESSGRTGAGEVVVFASIPAGADPAGPITDLTTAGATRIAVTFQDSDGRPDGSAALLHHIDALGEIVHTCTDPVEAQTLGSPECPKF